MQKSNDSIIKSKIFDMVLSWLFFYNIFILFFPLVHKACGKKNSEIQQGGKAMKKTARKVIAAFLALAITAGTLPMALASDTLPYLGESARGENQAFQHGYRAEDFLDWSPETDPYAEYLRAQVPLQDRNAALAATQASTAEICWNGLPSEFSPPAPHSCRIRSVSSLSDSDCTSK